MQNYKKVTKAGSIGIPAYIRRDVNIQPGDVFEVVENMSGRLVLVPNAPRCVFCSGTEDVTVVSGRGICRNCHMEIGRRLEHGTEE